MDILWKNGKKVQDMVQDRICKFEEGLIETFQTEMQGEEKRKLQEKPKNKKQPNPESSGTVGWY